MTRLSPPLVVGDNTHSYSGRAWVRTFPHGDVEALYRSECKSPSGLERFNTWLAQDGDDNFVTAAQFYGASFGGGLPKQERAVLEPETNEDRVKRRAKQKLRWACKCIGADRLLSLTFRENLTDYARAEEVLTAFLAQMRRRYKKNFRFAAVPETQKRGAWHFHLALRGHWNINVIRAYWWRALGERVGWSSEGKPILLDATQSPGNVDITNPNFRGQRRRTWDIDRLSAYLAKYVGKVLGEHDLGGKPSYRCTRGLHPDLQRFCVRANKYGDVVAQFFGIIQGLWVDDPFLFRSPDKAILWAAGRVSSVFPQSHSDSLEPLPVLPVL